jgi:hypothetical protein
VPRLQTPQRRRRTSGLARSFMAESRGPEPHTFRCHRCSKPCRRACPVDSPRWRTAEALIPSAEAPTRFPIEAGGAPVHCPNDVRTAGLPATPRYVTMGAGDATRRRRCYFSSSTSQYR